MNEKIKTLAIKEEIEKIATKGESKEEQEKIGDFQIHDLSLFIDQSYFVNDGLQLY